jgi:hypothetical protein
MEFKLNDFHRNVPEHELLDDLKRVAKKLGKNNLTTREYDEPGKYGSRTIQTRFGNWNKALEKAGLQITLNRNISDKELFENLEEVWISLGRQPTYRDIKPPISKFSTAPYDKRFGTWRKALEAFVGFMNSENDQNQESDKIESDENIIEMVQESETVFNHKTKRIPSERLKVQVLMRDGNRCRLCGVMLIGEDIHFDHILAWSKGGETVLENLQVLCAKHNLAKGNV